jgi:predicted transcriptional regulator
MGTTAESPKVNITIKLDKALVRKIRVLAAENGTSMSALIAAKFEEDLAQRERYEEAKKKAIAFMEEGWKLGGRPVSREELHKR